MFGFYEMALMRCVLVIGMFPDPLLKVRAKRLVISQQVQADDDGFVHLSVKLSFPRLEFVLLQYLRKFADGFCPQPEGLFPLQSRLEILT